MRGLERNKRTLYYALYSGKTPIVDEYGNETSEYLMTYADAVEMKANVSPATGASHKEQFGNLDNYDKVIVTTDIDCPIDENSILWIDLPLEYNADGAPIYDYIVRRVAKSINSISIAISKASTS